MRYALRLSAEAKVEGFSYRLSALLQRVFPAHRIGRSRRQHLRCTLISRL